LLLVTTLQSRWVPICDPADTVGVFVQGTLCHFASQSRSRDPCCTSPLFPGKSSPAPLTGLGSERNADSSEPNRRHNDPEQHQRILVRGTPSWDLPVRHARLLRYIEMYTKFCGDRLILASEDLAEIARLQPELNKVMITKNWLNMGRPCSRRRVA
jgi:hypothetical protein